MVKIPFSSKELSLARFAWLLPVVAFVLLGVLRITVFKREIGLSHFLGEEQRLPALASLGRAVSACELTAATTLPRSMLLFASYNVTILVYLAAATVLI